MGGQPRMGSGRCTRAFTHAAPFGCGSFHHTGSQTAPGAAQTPSPFRSAGAAGLPPSEPNSRSSGGSPPGAGGPPNRNGGADAPKGPSELSCGRCGALDLAYELNLPKRYATAECVACCLFWRWSLDGPGAPCGFPGELRPRAAISTAPTSLPTVTRPAVGAAKRSNQAALALVPRDGKRSDK